MAFNKRMLPLAPVNKAKIHAAGPVKPGADINISWSCFRNKGADPQIEELEWKLKNGLATDNRKRLSRSEQNTYMKMIAVTELLIDIQETAENWKRFGAIPRGMQMLKTCLTLMHKLVNGIIKESQALQMIEIRKQLPYMRVWLHSEDMKEDIMENDGRFLSHNDLNVLATAVRNECMHCTMTDEEQKSCMYRHVMEKMPADRPDDTRSGCPWMETLC